MNYENLFKDAETSDQVFILVCFYFSILIEYQLIHLQANVRYFVTNMSQAIATMDGLVETEGKSAKALFLSLFKEAKESDASVPMHMVDPKAWESIAQKIESFCQLEDRLRPQVYTMIESLNFEDIQSQRLEHLLAAQKKLNEATMDFIRKGFNQCSRDEVLKFALKLITETRSSYTMSEERNVFDQVFAN